MITIDLSGRGAIVTGGGQGLGAAIVRALHRGGASVAINFFPDPDGANQRTAEHRRPSWASGRSSWERTSGGPSRSGRWSIGRAGSSGAWTFW